MAILCTMRGGRRHFLKGDRLPFLPQGSAFFDVEDFMGFKIRLRVNEVESLVPITDDEVRDFLAELKKKTSRFTN